MGTFRISRPSNGTVLGFIAIVIALVGTADAAPTRLVHSDEIAPGAVTARALAKGAVHAKSIAKSAVKSAKLAKGAVTKRALANSSVSANALADDAVTARALAPGSIYGGALGPRTIHTVSITDIDQVASNPEWTASGTQNVLCAPGEALLSPGFQFTQPGNREVSWLRVSPFLSPTGDGVSGEIASNSGGTSKAELIAVCLR